MKKSIKITLLIVISIIISCIFACIPAKSANLEKPADKNNGWDKTTYNYREFNGLSSGAEGFNLYYDDLINEASYLCAWHGGHFFYRQPVILSWGAEFYGKTWSGEYTAEETWEHFVDGSWERNKVDKIFVIEGIPYDNVKDCLDAVDVKRAFNITLEATAYSGRSYYESVQTFWGEDDESEEGGKGRSKSGNPEVTVTSTGWTRFTVILDHQHEKNNAMSYLLADCEDNAGIEPCQSYVNWAFWTQLSARGIGQSESGSGSQVRGTESISSNLGNISASSMNRAISATMSEHSDVEKFLTKLNEGGTLSDEACDDIYDTAKVNQLDKDAYEMLLIINEYKKDENKNNIEVINRFKELLENLIKDMMENSEDDDLKDERKQNSVDFDGMWDEITNAGGSYENTIADATEQTNVLVEYNATTQKYLVGPFTIEYTEKYTSNWNLAGMAGDPVLMLRKDGNSYSLRKSTGKWNFYYLNGLRTDGIPGTGQDGQDDFGYNQYPHNGEPFYIQLDYEEGIEKILGLELHFRYMQSEAEWSRSKGEIENVKWSGGLGFARCRYQSGDKWIKGLCDGGAIDIEGKCHNDSNSGGKTHWHVNDSENGDHNMGRTHTNCDNYEAHKECNHECDDDECDHECSNEEIGCDGWYECKGHECGVDENKGARKCTHGYYGDHYAEFYLWLEGACDGTTEEIQYIGTCHWAWRYYYEVTKKIDWNIDITTSLEGDVWLDIDAQKEQIDNVEDGNWEEGSEHGVKDVLVTIKLYQTGKEPRNAIAHNNDGTRIDWPQRTDGSGHYHVDRIEAPGGAGGSNCYYVAEFEYDGQVYESTVFLQNNGGDDTAGDYLSAYEHGNQSQYFKKSMAVERLPERRLFDESFSEISGGSPMNADYTTTGNSPGGSIDYKPSEDKMKKVSEELSKDSDKDLRRSEFISAATEDHENMKDNWEGSYARYGIKAYTYYADGENITTGSKIEDYQIYYPFDDEGKAYGEGDIRYILNNYRGSNSKTGRNYIDEYMLHINLGLKKRKETDISLLKDLYKMTIVVNEQEIVQNFNCLVSPKKGEDTTVTIQRYNEDYKTLKGVLEARRESINKNELGLYGTDVAYSSKSRYKNAIGEVQDIKANTELRVFATYAIRIYNNSDTNDVTINELTDYYDSTYTLIDNENDGIEGMDSGKDGIYASIVKENMERTYKRVADKPYYRVLSTASDYEDISWKPTKEENLENIEESKKGIVTWSSSGTAGDMNKSKTSSLKDYRLKVNEYIEIFTTYEIDYDGFSTMAANAYTDIDKRKPLYEQEKNNVAEISKYSTFYSERDVQTEDGTAINFYKAYEEGKNSGKIDKDSAPDNIQTSDPKNMEYYEDDTSKAIPLNIKIEDYERDMYGYVFEDKKTENAQYNLKVGNGIYGTEDLLVKNVKVSMFEVISLGEVDTLEESSDIQYNDLDYYYEIPQEFYNIGEGEILTLEGNAVNKKGETVKGNYYIYGYLPADYILRFDYGTLSDGTATIYSTDESGAEHPSTENIIKYNGQDYENTSFLSAGDYKALNDKYLNLRTKDMKSANGGDGIKAIIQQENAPAYSVARDNEARRMVVNAFSRTIENDRGEILRDRKADNRVFVEATSMFAETPIMQIEINQPKDLNDDTKIDSVEVIKTIDNKVDDGNKSNLINHQYHIENINFGLEERAKTDINVEQYIESIFLMKDDEVIFSATFDEETGDVITDDEDNKHLDKLTYLSHFEANNSNQQGFYAISVEDDYLNGLSMKIDYRIKIINNSEVDFTGTLAKYYRAEELIKQASYPPTTEAYTRRIEQWLKDEENEDVIGEGVATNATLAEMLRLFGREGSGVLSELLSRNEGRIGSSSGDKIGTKDTLRPDIIVYGKYVGRYYYENKVDEGRKTYTIKQYKWADKPDVDISYQSDKIVKTTIDQLIDYIDTNASYDLTTQNSENCAWDLSGNLQDTGTRKTIPTLDAIVSESSYRTIQDNTGAGKSNIYDKKGNALVTDVSSNIVIAKNNKITKFNTLSGKNPTGSGTYLVERLNNNWVEYREDYKQVKSKDNKALTVELTPNNYDHAVYKGKHEVNVWLTTAKTTASDTDANNMKFDNLVEVLVYSNPTGRRDVYSVPGNAMALATKEAIGFWKAGYNSKNYWKVLRGKTNDTEFKVLAAEHWTANPEDDAYAPEFVTIIAPTGITLREYIRNVIIPITILVIILIIMTGTFGIKQIKIYKKRNDF